MVTLMMGVYFGGMHPPQYVINYTSQGHPTKLIQNLHKINSFANKNTDLKNPTPVTSICYYAYLLRVCCHGYFNFGSQVNSL